MASTTITLDELLTKLTALEKKVAQIETSAGGNATYHDVKSTYAKGTTYANNKGKDTRLVLIWSTGHNSINNGKIYVNGSVAASSSSQGDDWNYCEALIPKGATFSYSCTHTVQVLWEVY